MKSKIKKWGNSAAVRVPAAVLAAARMKADQPVDIREENGRIVIEPVAKPRKYTLKELLKGYSEKNRHEETDWGPPVGKEFW